GVTNGIAAGVGGHGWTPFIVGLQTFGNNGWGFDSTNVFQITGNSFLNNDRLGELHINLAFSTNVENGFISDSYFQFAGVAYGGAPCSTNTTAPIILVDTQSGPITIENNHFFGTQGNAIWIKGPFTRVANNRVLASGQGGVAGNTFALKVESTTGDE